jgi:Gpi18-like mannosyltransferase
MNHEKSIVLLSLLVQMPIAVFLGHYYDERVFMATGYLVSSGIDPYKPFYLTRAVFGNLMVAGPIPNIGYPPPLPLLLGVIFRFSYNLIPNLFLYNFVIKVPVIAANILLAYVVRKLIIKLNASKKKANYAWLFVLFNPFVLLTSTAWGEFDTVVALLCVASLYFTSEGSVKISGLILGFSIVLKPIALPLAGLPLLFSNNNGFGKKLQYLFVFAATLLACYFLPFFLFRWALPWGPNQWNTSFQMAGGLTFFNLGEIFRNSFALPSGFEFLGFLWVPALLITYYVIYRNRPSSMSDLFQKAMVLILVFFLTRSWLSEPNINLLLPLMLIALKPKSTTFRSFHFAWIIPLVFMFLNFSFPQLFFLVSPSIMPALTSLDQQIGTARLIARFLIVIPWQLLAWNLVAKTLRGSLEK